MRRFRFTLLAEQDLTEIVDYISSERDPERAEAVLEDLLDAADKLAEMPGMGHVRADLTDEAVLFWTVHKFLVVYRPETRPLEIIRVVHGSRSPRVFRSQLSDDLNA